MKKIQDESKYQKAKRRTDGSDWEIAKSLCELFFFFGGLVWFSYGRRRRRWKRGELCIEIRRRPTNIHIPQSKIRPDFIPNLVNFPTWFLNYRASNAKEKEKQKKNETSNKKWNKIIPMNILVDGGVVGCIYTKGYRHNKRGQEDFVWKIESLGWKQKGKGWAWRWEKRRGERERERVGEVGPTKILPRDTGDISRGAFFPGCEIMWRLPYLEQVGECWQREGNFFWFPFKICFPCMMMMLISLQYPYPFHTFNIHELPMPCLIATYPPQFLLKFSIGLNILIRHLESVVHARIYCVIEWVNFWNVDRLNQHPSVNDSKQNLPFISMGSYHRVFGLILCLRFETHPWHQSLYSLILSTRKKNKNKQTNLSFIL